MRVEKILKGYYERKLAGLPDRKSVPARPLDADTVSFQRRFAWSDAFGVLLMAGAAIHFLLGGQFFRILCRMPGFPIKF